MIEPSKDAAAEATTTLQRRKIELGTFLRQRRTALRPEDVGLRPIGRRHVKGLRREELASVAGISGSWYTLLEQGRAETVTPRTIGAIADALRLSRTERAHLLDLASNSYADLASDLRPPPPGLVEFVRAYPLGPAHLDGRCFELLAWNELADEMFNISAHLPRPNLLRIMVDEPRVRDVFVSPDWAAVLRMMVGHFRVLYAQHGGSDFDDLAAELSAKSPEFTAAWNERAVFEAPPNPIEFRHPRLGESRYFVFGFVVPDCRSHYLILMSPTPERWAADQAGM